MKRSPAVRTSRRGHGALLAIALAVASFPGVSTARAASIAPGTSNPAPDTSAIVAVRSGDVAIVDVFKRTVQIARGGSATEFSLEPPENAVCPGDSEHDSWRVQTFIAPAAVDPGRLDYGVVGPTGEHQYAVYDTFTAPLVDVLAVPNPGPGGSAHINEFPPMSFAVFPPGELVAGHYRIGVACTYFGKTANYWDTEIVIAAAPGDKPAQLVWHLPNQQSATAGDSHSGSRTWIVLVLCVLVAAVGGWFFWRRRTRKIPDTRTDSRIPVFSKEPK